MRYQFKFSVILSLLLAACSQTVTDVPAIADTPPPISNPVVEARAPAATINASVPVIVMLGDSLTAGYGLGADEALPDQIEALLRERGLETEFINAGVSGDTTAGGLARYDWSVASADADLLLIALGANDYLRGLPVEQARVNLAAILDRANADGLPAVLLGLSPRGKDGSDPEAEAFSAMFSELADAYGVPAYPDLLTGVLDRPDLLQADRLHPTAEGTAVIADGLAVTLSGIISDLANENPD